MSAVRLAAVAVAIVFGLLASSYFASAQGVTKAPYAQMNRGTYARVPHLATPKEIVRHRPKVRPYAAVYGPRNGR